MVDYVKFAPVMVAKIEQMYSIDAIRRKSQLCHLGHFKVSHIRMPKYDEHVLFSAFRKFDADKNGFLEWNEYQDCLEGLKELGLSTPECFALNMLADISGNGKIDYPEFMKHFQDIVFLLKFHNSLQALYDEERAQTRFSDKMAPQ